MVWQRISKKEAIDRQGAHGCLVQDGICYDSRWTLGAAIGGKGSIKHFCFFPLLALYFSFFLFRDASITYIWVAFFQVAIFPLQVSSSS